jgi:hypothetical protein
LRQRVSAGTLARSRVHRTLAETIDAFARGIRASSRPEDRKLASDYLAALAPLLAATVLGRDVLAQLPQIDRLFGHTWLHDGELFRDAFAKWTTFKAEYLPFALGSMTVNERLSAMGTLESFDRALETRDADQVSELLRAVYVDEASIKQIIAGL